MKTSLLAALALPALVMAGCGGGDKHSTAQPDLAMSIDMMSDLATSDGCSTMTFPSDPGSLIASEGTGQGFDWIDQVGSLVDNGDSTIDFMQYGYWHMASAAEPSLPHTVTLPTSTTYSACVDCLAVSLGQPASQLGDPTAGALYFAQSGTITATALDHASETGTISVSGSSIRLVHWQLGQGVDQAAPDGKCIDVAKFDFSASYDSSSPDP